VLFNWMWHQGMLKGTDERDMVAMLEYQAKGGTIQVDGQPCTLSKFRESTNFQTFSQRIQYTCTRPNKQTYSNVEVVSWQYAWNEDTPGAEIAGTKGKTAPMPAAVQERLIRIWASPQGAPKSALAGTMDTWTLGANPGTAVADGVMKVGNTSVSWDAAGKPVVTFPIPGVPGATGTATLDAKYMTEKVVVTQGATTTEFTYSNYQDWNNPLHKIEVFYAGRLIERKNGAVVRDVTTRETETGNVYVVAPVPPSVQKAMNVTTKAPTIVFAKQEPPANRTAPTPRLGGRPDLTGSWAWNDWIGNYMGNGGRRCGPTQERPCNRATNQTEDFALYSPSRFGQLGRPLYKPEHWDKVQQLDMWTNKYDPVMTCQPLGVPRQGPPRRIWQTENDITFLYMGGDAGGGYGEYRIIPTDNRQRGPDARFELNYMGNSVGHWELGGRHARDRLHRLHRHDVDRTRRVLPFREDACHREVHASGRCDQLRRDGRRPGGVSGAAGVPDAGDPAQHGRERGSDTGTRQLRDGFRDGSGGHADSTLDVVSGFPGRRSAQREGGSRTRWRNTYD